MDPYLWGAAICGIIALVVVSLVFAGGYFNEQTDSETPTLHLSTPARLPIISVQIFYPPTFPIPLPPLFPLNPYQATEEQLKEHDLKREKYLIAQQEYELKKAEYDQAMKEYTVSQIMTVSYGDMILKTDKIELKIHELINNEREKHNLEPLSYDYAISNIARKHSADMALNDYFAHEDQHGKGPADRGHEFGYTECGDRSTIQLMKEYNQLLQEFEDTGSTDITMYNQLELTRNMINLAIEHETVFGGLSENISKDNLYDKYWMTDGVITSYEWQTPEEIAKSTVEGWMNSEGHRKNILTPYYTSEGIGVNVESDSTVLITQNFC